MYFYRDMPIIYNIANIHIIILVYTCNHYCDFLKTGPDKLASPSAKTKYRQVILVLRLSVFESVSLIREGTLIPIAGTLA